MRQPKINDLLEVLNKVLTDDEKMEVVDNLLSELKKSELLLQNGNSGNKKRDLKAINTALDKLSSYYVDLAMEENEIDSLLHILIELYHSMND